MQAPFTRTLTNRTARWWPALLAALLAACGGGSQTQEPVLAEPEAEVATASTTLDVDGPDLPAADAARMAEPSFHVAPVLLQEPDDIDALQPGASATRAPRMQTVPAGNAALSTRHLTVGTLLDAQRRQRLSSLSSGSESAADSNAAPAAGSGVVATYSPAQVRAAYGLPALPAAGSVLNAAQAAQLGAGQTLYVVGARHNPNVAAELAAFNQKFGLPGCTTKVIAVTAALPLAAASASACELSVVYTNTTGSRTATAPAYDSGWATELALDVQWAHATAPLARIVLIEAPDPSVNSLLGAVRLANAMGPGVVSMSFGTAEAGFTAQVDSAFAGAGMSYLAATGDWGTGVFWPSVSPNVVAVGGTTLTWSGSGTRSETAWSGTGGGLSAYTARPAYQTAAIPGLGTPVRRTLADVAFNADPSSGQYVAVMSPGSTAVNWISAGGTSLSTPQWAGLLAVANAMRVQTGKPVLGSPHAMLYQQIGAVPGTYAGAFADILQGSNGTCSLCTARAGHDSLTGLGTPKASALLSALGGASASTLPPVVTAAAISGQVGTALSFTVSVSAPNPVSYTLTGAPAGMAIAANGVVTWATPVAGTYSVTVSAKDSKTALTGKAVYVVTIAPPTPPVVAAASVSGKVGTPLSFAAKATSANALTWSLTGAPAGMAISSAGAVSWPAPVAGSYSIKLNARDSKTGLTGQGTLTVAIAAANAPTVANATVAGQVGKALSMAVAVTAPNPVTYTLTGAPAGMAIASSGMLSWASPAAGTYSVKVSARDTKTGLTGQGTITVQIAAATSLSIAAPPMNGVAGKALTGSIAIAAPGASSVSITISGVPLGMMFTPSGTNLAVKWASPVKGSYSLKVAVKDSQGRTASATVPVTITAQ
jgi:hypothetical protein